METTYAESNIPYILDLLRGMPDLQVRLLEDFEATIRSTMLPIAPDEAKAFWKGLPINNAVIFTTSSVSLVPCDSTVGILAY